MTNSSKSIRVAVLQLMVGDNKNENIENAIKHIRKVVKESKPRVVALPECFNSTYSTKCFAENAENVPNGPTSKILSDLAKELKIYIIGGTIPEKDEKNLLYNTCTVWGPNGELIGKHRKVHLFDMEIPGRVQFKESEVLTPGTDINIVDIDNMKVGIIVCYDIRFEEFARLYRNQGCDLLVCPAAFDMYTGPLHWELLQRGRANDNQMFVMTISCARNEKADYIAWGHSMIIDPWGRILKSAEEKEEILIEDLDLSIITEIRSQIPISHQRRTDLYDTIWKKSI